MNLSRPLLLLALIAFLAPLIGGHLNLDVQGLPSGLGPLLQSIIQGPEAATLSHGLIALLLVGAVIGLTGKRQVIQLPIPRIAIIFVLFLGILFLSIAESQYKMVSLTSWAEWATGVIAFFAVVAGSGRKLGPRLITGAIFISCVVLALLGVWEYITQPDPSWRIFSLWHHPNALAGILLLGLFCGLALGITGDSKNRWGSFAGVALIVVSLGLTQSKGGYVAAAAGMVFLLALCFLYAGTFSGSRRAAYVVGTFVAAAVIMVGVQKLQHMGPAPAAPIPAASQAQAASPVAQGSSSAPLSRILDAGGTQDQSIGFRKNLWKGCIALIKENPLGWGIGTYVFECARPGLTIETQLAHESYLQLAVEGGVIAALLLVVGLFFCLFESFKGSRKLPLDQNLLRAGIVAGLFASCIHNAIDSDWYVFGNNIAFFMLLGLVLQLSSDAVIPEFVPRFGRAIGAGGASVACAILLYSGLVAVRIANEAGGSHDFASLQGLAPWDNRVWYSSSGQAKTVEDAIADLKKAIDCGPTEAEYRRLSDLEAQSGQMSSARSTLLDGLKMDPNNLNTLFRLFMLDSRNAPEDAVNTAKRLVAVEDTDYFKTRALPELVPTETYRARLYLANQLRDPKAQAEMLKPAIEGFLSYSRATLPQILRMQNSEGSSVYGRKSDAKTILGQAVEAAKALLTDYTLIKDTTQAKWAADAQRELESALGSIDRSSK